MIEPRLPNLLTDSPPLYVRKNTLLHACVRLIKARRADYLAHWVYGHFAKAKYYFCSRNPALNEGLQSAFERLRSHGFVVINDVVAEEMRQFTFARIIQRLSLFCETHRRGYRPLQYILKRGYTGIQAEHCGQIHIDVLAEEELIQIRRGLEQSGIGNLIRKFLRCNYGVCNVRVWRFLPAENLGNEGILPHSDNFPANIVKLMYFAGVIDPDHGGLEFFDRNGNMLCGLTGQDVVVLFDPTNVIHGSPPPKTGYRDTVELTVMPQMANSTTVVSAGFQAGYPYFPWRNWAEPCHWILGR